MKIGFISEEKASCLVDLGEHKHQKLRHLIVLTILQFVPMRLLPFDIFEKNLILDQ